MREYMKNLGTIMMMIALSNMLIPKGGIKKFATLATGFMLITAAVAVVPKNVSEFSFSSPAYTFDEKRVEEAEERYREQVMENHRENIEKLISENFVHPSKAQVETDGEGNITKVTLYVHGDESRAISYIVNELSFPRERITIEYEKN